MKGWGKNILEEKAEIRSDDRSLVVATGLYKICADPTKDQFQKTPKSGSLMSAGARVKSESALRN
jgi:hypothetical protein